MCALMRIVIHNLRITRAIQEIHRNCAVSFHPVISQRGPLAFYWVPNFHSDKFRSTSHFIIMLNCFVYCTLKVGFPQLL